MAISAGGVAESVDQVDWPVRRLIELGQVGVAYRDLASMEQVLAASRLDWLAVRPVTLVNGAPTGRAGPVSRYRLWSCIRRGDVAAWMLDALEAPAPYTARRVLIGDAGAAAADHRPACGS